MKSLQPNIFGNITDYNLVPIYDIITSIDNTCVC